MKTNFRAQETAENNLIGDIMADGNDDFFNLRISMGKSTSAPPPGLSEPFSSSSPRMKQSGFESDKTATKEYYDYYYSLKPLDPRLPKPKWKPNLYGASTFGGLIHPIQEEPQEGKITRTSSISDKGYTNDDLSTQFDQSLELGDNAFSQNQSYSRNNNNTMQYQNQGNRGYQSGNYNNGQNQYQNQHHNQHHQQQQQQHQHQHRQHQGGYKGQGQGQGGQNTQGHQGQGYSHPRQQQGKHQQNQNYNQNQPQQYNQGGQFYGNQQMQGMYDPNFMRPQMQVPVQPYYGMNPYQPQMYPYPNMDPNMANMNPGARMSPMTNMNQFYPNPYMQGAYYPMGMQPQMPQMAGGFQPSPYPNQQQQQMQMQNQQQQPGHKNQKPYNKNQGNVTNMPKQDMKSILMRLIENCRDQNGSRLIQQHFEKVDEEEREQMFEQILPHAFSLMTDVFGNYVIQKILELGTDEQRRQIYDTMEGRIFELCQNTYGCRVVQRALEKEKNNEELQDKILEEICNNILDLIEDPNGNHVVQKCFENTPPEKLGFIINEVGKNIDKLAFHAFGCRVIQRILEYCPSEMTSFMTRKLMDHAIKCCECQYGNYIMQHILEKGPNEEKEQLLKIVSINFVHLSMNKFASNVTEKSAIHGTPEFKKEVVRVLLNTYHDNKLGLIVLMTHPYGNYVVQRLFECGNEQLRRTIYEATQGQNAEEIKKTSYGKHVMGFIEKVMEGKQRNQ